MIVEVQGKSGNVFSVSFAAQKFLPGGEQIFGRNDIVVTMAEGLNSLSLSLSLEKASILQRIKEGYLLWIDIVPHIPKGGRYTIGARIENKFLDLLEQSYLAYFTIREKRAVSISQCILTLDTLKFLVYVGWEGKLVTHKQYAVIAPKLDEIGKMLYGWKISLKNLDKKNRIC